MSFFISSIALSGFRSSPPVSKQTPLPTSVTFGCLAIAPAQIDQPRRTRRGAADGMDQRKILQQQFAVGHRLDPGVVTLGEQARRLMQFRRAHVVRRRVDQVARQRHALGDARKVGGIDAVRQHQRRELILALAIAVEAIASERESEAGEPRVVRRIGECDTRQAASRPGRLPGSSGLALAVSFSSPNRTPAMPPSQREREMPSGLGLEACGLGKGPCRALAGRRGSRASFRR